MDIDICYWASPVGELLLGSYGDRLCLCDWVSRRGRTSVDARLRCGLSARYVLRTTDIVRMAIRQLDEYFRGERTQFDIPLLTVGTDFQREVWCAISRIPYGRTVSYLQLAEAVGRPSAVRAVAGVCGSNAISILIPCHRVVGAKGDITGYAGGVDAKRRLLSLECSRVG